MMLFSIIRDFFVRYIFGGILSDNSFVSNPFIGNITAFVNGSNDDSFGTATGELLVIINGYVDPNYNINETTFAMSIGDYLSTTATIITLVVLAVVVALGIRWLFRFLISRFTKWGL